MELLALDEVLARLERAVAEAGVDRSEVALAFDGDGTLWSGDVGEDFFHATVAADRYLPPAVDAMRAVGRAAGLEGMDEPPRHGDRDSGAMGREVARRVFQGYLDHKVPEDVLCELIAWACAGWREEEVARLAANVVLGTRLDGRRHREVGEVLAWARKVGVEAFLVSASPRPIVEAAAAPLGFDRAHVLAATAPFVDGVMLAEVIRPIPYGPGKATLLQARLQGRVLLAAFGDNVFDVPMLQAARVAVAVEPKRRLLDHLATLEPEGAGFWSGRPPVQLRVQALRE